VFLHISAVERAGLTGLSDNESVNFDIVSGRGGREAAENLEPA
jgi:CspA family cold shock protein